MKELDKVYAVLIALACAAATFFDTLKLELGWTLAWITLVVVCLFVLLATIYEFSANRARPEKRPADEDDDVKSLVEMLREDMPLEELEKQLFKEA